MQSFQLEHSISKLNHVPLNHVFYVFFWFPNSLNSYCFLIPYILNVFSGMLRNSLNESRKKNRGSEIQHSLQKIMHPKYLVVRIFVRLKVFVIVIVYLDKVTLLLNLPKNSMFLFQMVSSDSKDFIQAAEQSQSDFFQTVHTEQLACFWKPGYFHG